MVAWIRDRFRRRAAVWLAGAVVLGAGALLAACAPEKAREPRAGDPVPANVYDPAIWGEQYPAEYHGWLRTRDARAEGSKYKRGGERTGEFDKLSEYPFMATLVSGFGFSVEFNEPRGHYWALRDQNRIDPARLSAGGVCLACKTPYWETLREEHGEAIYAMPYRQAVQLIPERDRELGVSCADCHERDDMSLATNRDIIRTALESIGKTRLSRSEQEIVVCGQCHSTYVIPKEGEAPDRKSVGLFLPWGNGEWGDISVEDIIETIRSDPANNEWVQRPTGFSLGYIRHPEIELYTRGGVHFRNGVTCPDCHMPFKIEDGAKVADHNVQSPLDDNMRACLQCHEQSPAELRETVIGIQDKMMGQILNAGYAVTADAKLFEIANSSIETRSAEIEPLYEQARDAFEQAFYRVAYISAENSVGFHNPPEAQRIASDALAYSRRCESILRTLLAREGVEVPAEVDLELREALQNRGRRGLMFRPDQEFRDPSGVAEDLWRDNLARLRGEEATGGTQEP